MTWLKNNKGFSLVELLIYIGIFTATSVFLISILIVFTRIHVRQISINEVNSQISFVNNVIQQKVRSSSLIDMDAGVTTSTLNLVMSSSSIASTTIYLDTEDSIIYMREGSNDPMALTDANVSVLNFLVTKFENPGGHAILQIELTLTYNTQNPLGQFRRTINTAISRASAATFDDDILPNAGNAYDLGNSAKTWRDAYFSGSIGLGVTPVSGVKILSTGNIGFTGSSAGIILRSVGSNCYRLGITDGGVITTTTIACP